MNDYHSVTLDWHEILCRLVLNEVEISMNNTFIKLQTTKISGLSDMAWCGDEDDVQDLSKIKDWDLSKTQENLTSVQNWQSIEDNVLENQITRFVQKYFEDTGYTAEYLGSNKIYERDGRVALELDGLIIAESDVNEPLLVTVETKHSLREKHIDDRRKKLSKFINFLTHIPDDDDKSAPAKYRGSCGQLQARRDVSYDHL